MSKSKFIGKKRIYIMTCTRRSEITGNQILIYAKPFFGTLDAIEYSKKKFPGLDIPLLLKDWRKTTGKPEWFSTPNSGAFTFCISQQLIIGA